MKEKLKKIRGITLIALVVTIIVLLILAGVAISLSIGNNGELWYNVHVGNEQCKKVVGIYPLGACSHKDICLPLFL